MVGCMYHVIKKDHTSHDLPRHDKQDQWQVIFYIGQQKTYGKNKANDNSDPIKYRTIMRSGCAFQYLISGKPEGGNQKMNQTAAYQGAR